MSGSDDQLRGSNGTAAPAADSVDRPMRHARAMAKGYLRLVNGFEVLGKSHGRQIRRKWRVVKTENGGFPQNATFGYNFPMGKRQKNLNESEEMTPERAVALALAEVIPRRGIAKASAQPMVPHSTLRRLMEGKSKVSLQLIIMLRDLPGFGAAFDRIMDSGTPPVDFLQVARRLNRAFTPAEAERIAFQLEELAQFLNADGIIDLLKSQVRAIHNLKIYIPGAEPLPAAAGISPK